MFAEACEGLLPHTSCCDRPECLTVTIAADDVRNDSANSLLRCTDLAKFRMCDTAHGHHTVTVYQTLLNILAICMNNISIAAGMLILGLGYKVGCMRAEAWHE